MTDSYPAIDPALIIANYEPPEASLEPPNTISIPSQHQINNEDKKNGDRSSTFATPAVAGLISSSDISSTQNKPEYTLYKSLFPISNKSGGKLVTNVDIAPLFSNAGVRGRVTNVSHGTFYSKPATLIVFSFIFRSGDHGFRFRNANIKVTFSSLPDPTNSGSKSPNPAVSPTTPSVVKFAPRKVFGLPTHEGKKNTIGGEFSLEVPAGPVTVGPSISFGKEWEYETTHRFSSVGNFWSSKHGSDWDIVYWDIKENKRTGAGIPDRFNCAVIVERGEGEGFMATTEVTVDTPMGNGFLSRPWGREKPVVFAEETVFGRQPSSKVLESLGEEEWRTLAPFDGEWENRFTDEVVRRLTLEKAKENKKEETLMLDEGAVEGESDDR